jgi:hypothetical protein
MKKLATPQHLELVTKQQRQELLSLYFELQKIHEIAISYAKEPYQSNAQKQNGFTLIAQEISKRLDKANTDLLDEYELHNPVPLISPKDNRDNTDYTKSHYDMVSLGNSLKSLFILENE